MDVQTAEAALRKKHQNYDDAKCAYVSNPTMVTAKQLDHARYELDVAKKKYRLAQQQATEKHVGIKG